MVRFFCSFAMYPFVLIVFLVEAPMRVVFCQSQRLGNDGHNDTTRIGVIRYIGITSSIVPGLRTVGIPPEFAERLDASPVVTLGVHLTSIGSTLLQAPEFRGSFSLEKIINSKPSSRLLENFWVGSSFGYNIARIGAITLYPWIGYGLGTVKVDYNASVSLAAPQIGMGVEYIIPATPLMVCLESSYTHALNLRAADNVPFWRSTVSIRAYVSIYLTTVYSYWE